MSKELDFLKQFYVFSYSTYYPSGGLSDVQGTYDSLEEAKTACSDGSIFISSDTCYVWDKLSSEIIFDLYE